MERDRHIYEFDDFQLNPSESLLLRRGVPVALPKRAFEMLLVLVQRNSHLVEKSELINMVWEGAFVEEGNIAVIISMIRKALGDDRNEHTYIKTITKRGYRFVAEVRISELSEEVTIASQAKPESAINPHSTWLFSKQSAVSMFVGIGLLIVIALAGVDLVARDRVSAFGSSKKATDPSEEVVRTQREMPSPEVRQIYLEGQHYGERRTQEGLLRSIGYFQQAILKDPEYAEAYAGIADSYSFLSTFELKPNREEYPLAETAALKAVQLDDSLAEAHTSLGLVSFKYEWNWPKAESEFRRSIELNPKYASAYTRYASCLAAQGQFDQALEQAQHAEALDPLSVVANSEIGRVYYLSRRYEQSIAVFRHTVDLEPYTARAHIRLATVYAVAGDYSNALHELQNANQLSADDPFADGLLGYIEARSGKVELARKKFDALVERSKHQYVPAFSIALVLIGLNQQSQAMDWLEKAYRDHSEFFIYAKVDPLLDSERSDKRFVALLAGMNLQGENEKTPPRSFLASSFYDAPFSSPVK